MIYLDYLRNNKKAINSGLLMSDKLKEHLEDVDRQAEKMFEQLVKQMANNEVITEVLKQQDQIRWIQCMNSIRNRAEEIVLREVVFA